MATDDPSTGGVAQPICPVCRRDEPTTKVSAIYRQQTATSSETGLAGMLSPPAAPRVPSGTHIDDSGCLSIFFLLVAGMCGLMLWQEVLNLFTPRGFSPATFVTTSAVLAGSILLFGVISEIIPPPWGTTEDRYRKSDEGRRAFAQYEEARAIYERATAKWDRAYDCQKDDVCFVPGEAGYCAPPDFQRWLTE